MTGGSKILSIIVYSLYKNGQDFLDIQYLCSGEEAQVIGLSAFGLKVKIGRKNKIK